MLSRPIHQRSEQGETLVEVLVALMILGVAAVAILAGLRLSVSTSDAHRKQTSGGAYARSYAEAIQRHIASAPSNYADCAGSDKYDPVTVGFEGAMLSGGKYTITMPDGSTYAIKQERAWRVPPNGGPAVDDCSGNDTGVQQIKVMVSSIDGRAIEELVVLLRKPCSTVPVCTS